MPKGELPSSHNCVRYAVAFALMQSQRTGRLFDQCGIIQLLNFAAGIAGDNSSGFDRKDIAEAFANGGETEYPIFYESLGFIGDTHVLYVKKYRKRDGRRTRSFMFGRFTSTDAARSVSLVHETMPYPCIVPRSNHNELVAFLESRRPSNDEVPAGAGHEVVPRSELIKARSEIKQLMTALEITKLERDAAVSQLYTRALST